MGRITPPPYKVGVGWPAPEARGIVGLGAVIVIADWPGTDTVRVTKGPAELVEVGTNWAVLIEKV